MKDYCKPKRTVMWRLKRFGRNLKRLVQYAPIVWKLGEGDFAYILEVTKFEINRQAKIIEKSSYTENNKKIVSRMRTASRLIEKTYLKEEYYSEDYEKYQYLFEEKNFEEWATLIQKRQDKAEELLWKFIHHNIRWWWD